MLLDCEMPVMDGFDAAVAIRRFEVERGLPAVPIIALTAHAVFKLKERCHSAGMNAHLSKPVRLDVLEEAPIAWSGRSQPPARGRLRWRPMPGLGQAVR